MKSMLFNTEMVRATLAGRKSVTRRVVKPQPSEDSHNICFNYIENGMAVFGRRNKSPNRIKAPYRPGDILYVRETWAIHPCNDRLPSSIPCKKIGAGFGCYVYQADCGTGGTTPCGVYVSPHPWRPSIHMPREAARIFLRVTGVRAERLQDITIGDIHREGWPEYLMPTDAELRKMVEAFVSLWNSTIKPADRALYGWEANPWVWVIEFERVGKEEITT